MNRRESSAEGCLDSSRPVFPDCRDRPVTGVGNLDLGSGKSDGSNGQGVLGCCEVEAVACARGRGRFDLTNLEAIMIRLGRKRMRVHDLSEGISRVSLPHQR